MGSILWVLLYMNYWTWDKSLNLGITTIDAQHRHIADFINKLIEANITGDNILTSQALIGLLDYTITHFAFEEALIAQTNYPLIEGHKTAHNAFAERINRYKELHEAGNDIVKPLANELKLWLTQHIKIEDKQYVPYVKEKVHNSWLKAALTKFFGK